jgi:PKHD-type hydroxylase
MSYLPHFWIRHNAVPSELCELLLKEREQLVQQEATIGIEGQNQNNNLRKTNIAWLQKNHWLEAVMLNNINYANKEAGWNFIATEPEQVQMAKYEQEGFYDWHIDTFFLSNTPTDRKLTAIILLNDPSEFEGGHLEIQNSGVDFVPLQKGSIVVFPSYLQHRATPITKGTRYSAALWLHGPSFR